MKLCLCADGLNQDISQIGVREFGFNAAAMTAPLLCNPRNGRLARVDMRC